MLRFACLGTFGKLIKHEGDVSKSAVKDFDPRDEYSEVIQTIERAGDGKSTIFKLQHGQTRSQYYIVSLDGGHQRLVGLRALAVES